MLQKERDALADNASKSTDAVTAEKNALATQVAQLSAQVDQLKSSAQSNAGSAQAEITRLNEAFAALQRSTAQNTTELAATKALAQQLQGANTVLANENYQLKTAQSHGVAPAATVAAGTPVTPTAVTPAAPAARTHVVASGDSLSRLSQRYYGAANRWPEIYNANRDKIGSDGVLRVGTELRIP